MCQSMPISGVIWVSWAIQVGLIMLHRSVSLQVGDSGCTQWQLPPGGSKKDSTEALSLLVSSFPFWIGVLVIFLGLPPLSSTLVPCIWSGDRKILPEILMNWFLKLIKYSQSLFSDSTVDYLFNSLGKRKIEHKYEFTEGQWKPHK